jgi:hypothetical protein
MLPRAEIDETRLLKMAVSDSNGTKPSTGIKVIIVGAGMSSQLH